MRGTGYPNKIHEAYTENLAGRRESRLLKVDTASKQGVVVGEGVNECRSQHKIIRQWPGCEGPPNGRPRGLHLRLWHVRKDARKNLGSPERMPVFTGRMGITLMGKAICFQGGGSGVVL